MTHFDEKYMSKEIKPNEAVLIVPANVGRSYWIMPAPYIYSIPEGSEQIGTMAGLVEFIQGHFRDAGVTGTKVSAP